ncbi:MAG: serine/threonine protein kinase [Deltaproteobacteria bacterium]|nr:serine/threonine protein kinase [Deltaproteobacteria bacterium]MCB9479862.1 serine/threonine protein kinase [Deltaproteobacteria bacterium]
MSERIGPYEILESLGEGGMARAHLARRTQSGGLAKLCVIKRIRPELADDSALLDAFHEEARVALSLTHSHIVACFDYQTDKSGAPYMVLEWCDAGDAEGLLRALAQRGERLPIGAAVYVMRGVLAGLSQAHRAADAFGRPLNVVHRDVSPANVFLTFAGEVKLGDFGIARAAHRVIATALGRVKGKVAYLAPEQAHGHAADVRSDVFAAGVVLWEMLTGRRLFAGGETGEILARVKEAKIPRPDKFRDELPPRLTAVVLRALAKDPDDRFPDADAFLAELEAAADDLDETWGAKEFAALLAEALPERRAVPGRPKTAVLGEDDGVASDRVSPRGGRRRWSWAAMALLAAATAVFATQVILAPGPAMERHARPLPDVQPDATHAVLEVVTDEPGALVTLDGAPLGFTPMRRAVEAERSSKRTLRVSSPGRRVDEANMIVRAGREKTPSAKVRTPRRVGQLAPSSEDRSIAGIAIAAETAPALPVGLYRLESPDGGVEYVAVK